MKNIILTIVSLISILVFVTGCEHTKRGTPGKPGYISEDFRKVTIVHVENEFVKMVNSKVVSRNSYSVIEDDENRRYRVPGKVGSVGESFVMDISLLEKI